MSVLSVADTQSAVSVLRLAAAYDSMRVETYRQKERLHNRIRVSSFDSAIALRFDDVGYFNRVYSPDESVFERLEEIEEFYRASPFGCELVGPPEWDRTVRRPGWYPSTQFAWMSAQASEILNPVPSTIFDIRPVRPEERQQYLVTYLRAFGAEDDRIPAALRNMRHLFDLPELDFLIAWRETAVAGVGSMMWWEGVAVLCAGAALPEFRAMGCHTALLRARIQMACNRGCERLYSWAVSGGKSQANMERVGLETVGITQAWRFSPRFGT